MGTNFKIKIPNGSFTQDADVFTEITRNLLYQWCVCNINTLYFIDLGTSLEGIWVLGTKSVTKFQVYSDTVK